MDALSVAGYIVRKGNEIGSPVSNLQLQKILYFVQLESLKQSKFSDEIINPAEFEAWLFGPVISEVYYAYCVNGGLPIIDVANGTNLDFDFPPYIDEIVRRAVKTSPWNLVAISHREGGAWKQTYKEGCKLPINNDLIIKDAETFSMDCLGE